MTNSTNDFISWLNDLVETCNDGEKGFRDAAGGVQSRALRSILEEYARQRTQFAAELQRQVTSLGGDPATGGTASGTLHRGWINLKSAVTGKDDHAILSECERGEDSAVRNYQGVLAKDLPSELRSMVEVQYRQILQTHNRIRALRDGSGIESSVPVGSGASIGTRIE